MSATRLQKTMRAAPISRSARATLKSPLLRESKSKNPRPGQAKTVSVITAPPKMSPMLRATRVTVGSSASLSPCGPEVVRSQHVQHGTALEPAELGDADHGKRYDREGEMF